MPAPVPPQYSPNSPSEDNDEGQFAMRKAERARARRVRDKFAAGVLALVLLAGFGLVYPRRGRSGQAVALPQSPALKGAKSCDALVIGGTPSGVAAALAAARRGLSVTLVEERPHVGGDIRYAMLNMFDVPMALHTQKSPMAYGIFGQLYHRLGVGFDIDRASRIMAADLAHAKVNVLCSTRVARLYQEHSRLVGIAYKTNSGPEQRLAAGVVIDATNDASIAARAGVSYRLGRESANPDRRMQSAGLLFSVRGVNWDKVGRYVRSQRVETLEQLAKYKRGVSKSIDVRVTNSKGRPEAIIRLGGGVGNYYWERGDIVKGYVPHGPNIEILSINFGRQDDGSVVLNTLNIVGVNGLSAASMAQARREAVQELPYFLAYLRTHMPGFEKAQLYVAAPELYIRETRHIHGYYTLQVKDVRGNVRFPDRIALCSYPLDLHPFKKGDKNVFGPQRFYYTLPLRTLVPKRIDGLFVASRSLSADYAAAGSARVIPVTMAAGEAAGAAAWVCVREKLTPHLLMDNPEKIAMVQNTLRKAGADIGDEIPKSAVGMPVPKKASIKKPATLKGLKPAASNITRNKPPIPRRKSGPGLSKANYSPARTDNAPARAHPPTP